MGNVRNITAIAVQGRPHSVEYVTEFTISYGYNGLDYADFKEPGGNVKVNRTEWCIELCSYLFLSHSHSHYPFGRKDQKHYQYTLFVVNTHFEKAQSP